MTEVERPAMTALFNRVVLAEDKRDPLAAEAAETALAAPLTVLDGVVGPGRYLFGGEFTVADLNVAAILRNAHYARIDFDPSRMPQPGCALASPVRRRKRRSSCSRIRRFRAPRPRRPVSPRQAAPLIVPIDNLWWPVPITI